MLRTVSFVCLLLCLSLASCGSLPGATDVRSETSSSTAAMPERLIPDSWLVLGPVDDRGRRPFRPDAVLREYFVDGESLVPQEGDVLTGERQEAQSWELRVADERGSPLGEGAMGWATTTLESPQGGVMVARLTGAMTLWVNDRPVAGDYYGYGHGGAPVWLNAGENRLWVHGIRGRFALELTAPEAPLSHERWGDTLPDLISGAVDGGPLGLVVLNNSVSPLKDVSVTLLGDELFEPTVISLDHDIRPLAVETLTLPQRLRIGASIPGTVTSWLRQLEVRVDGSSEALLASTIELPIQQPDVARRVTFVSEIDGSVQYYGLLPPDPGALLDPAVDNPRVGPGRDAGLVLTLHGAGVQGFGQVKTYSQKPDFWIVAPTNRSPFGFDWQDWGRQDAYEVLEHALARTGVDRSRVYLTGHSMGGHGSWHLAANDPDTFAAVAPSAGWESFDSYGSRPEGEHRALWHGADGASQTLKLIDNLLQVPAFILHGDADDNVPAEQAESMIAALEAAGGSPESHFEPGAGHWWNGSASSGADCTDWPGFFALFRRSAVEENPSEVAFTSVDPSVDSTHHWVSFLQPIAYGRRSSFGASWDSQSGLATVETENVRAFALLEIGGEPVGEALVDGQLLELGSWPGSRILTLTDDGWSHGQLDLEQKRPSRSGPFKQAFDDDFVFVVGTHGDAAMTTALGDRAQQLAQEWRYRANGQATIMGDDDYLESPPKGNPILLGNGDCNSAWSVLLPADGEPIRWDAAPWPDDWRGMAAVGGELDVAEGAVTLGKKRWLGADIGAVFVRPRPGGLVGAFGFSGLPAVRASYALSPFVSGVGFPDYAVYDSSVLGVGDGGVLAAGWFDHGWSLPESLD
ncbi:MAG: dienelactone hydrolase [Pseudohongiellaceae bacterium]|jgi:dienelactone hydrolase